MSRQFQKLGYVMFVVIFIYVVVAIIRSKSHQSREQYRGNSHQSREKYRSNSHQSREKNKSSATGSTRWEMDAYFPKIPHKISDHIYYMVYDGKNVFTEQDTTRGKSSRAPFQMERKMFNQVKDEAIRYFKSQKQIRYQRQYCNFIRYRLIPTVGMEFDVTCYSSSKHQSDRVTMRQLFQSREVVFSLHRHHTSSNKVNIILPLMGRPETFQLFLENIKRVQNKRKQVLGLTVVYFDDDYTEVNRKILEDSRKSGYGLETQFIVIEHQPFSRSKGMQVGVEKTVITADVVFLCDVDILFTADFLMRCQTSPVQGYQVYFPVVFSLYNPEFIYAMEGTKIPEPLDMLKIGDHHGFWRLWGHGMVCLHKVDFLKIKGFNQNRKGWGGEDVYFLNAAIKRKYKIIRAFDPGLFHRYHYKSCDEVGKGQNKSCLRVQAMSEASQLSLGLWFYREKYNTSVYGILSDGSQPFDLEIMDSESEDENNIPTAAETETRTPRQNVTKDTNQICVSETSFLTTDNLFVVSFLLNVYFICVYLIPRVFKAINRHLSDIARVPVYQKVS